MEQNLLYIKGSTQEEHGTLFFNSNIALHCTEKSPFFKHLIDWNCKFVISEIISVSTRENCLDTWYGSNKLAADRATALPAQKCISMQAKHIPHWFSEWSEDTEHLTTASARLLDVCWLFTFQVRWSSFNILKMVTLYI